VAKHGNRSVSSKSGSADVLEALGITLAADAAAVIDLLNKHNFAFLFAPFFHPAMKNIAPIRQALGIRTVFNILGPLTNPAQPTHYLLGAFSSEMAKLMAGALSGMNIERAFVIHGCNGWDEPTPVCPFEMYDVTANNIQFTTRDPQEFGIPKCSGEDLRGGTAEHNAKSLLNVFENKDQGAHRDALMLGTALALELAGVATDIEQGVQQAKETIETGTAAEFIHNLMQLD
jgi:anthranilate phosphoribosyltransferase